LAYEQLKEKLQQKGYFATERKKSQPKYIKKIALVTASKSAALQDMLKIIDKRWRLLEVVVIDTLVQGDKSAPQIAEVLAYADTLGCDAIVVGRGGGSREDLWAFNEEVVADALFNLNTFVVSAVGHEVDVQISDFVADLRAPTPSAAIEMILPDQNEVLYMLGEMQERYIRTIGQIVSTKETALQALSQELQRQSVSRKITLLSREFETIEEEFKRVMEYKMAQHEAKLPPLTQQLHEHISYALQMKSAKLSTLKQQIALNNPKSKQKDGWAEIVLDGKRVKLSTIKKGDRFTLTDIESSLKVEAL
jgi:exodeoxyribonuclease VII large subunit